MADTWVRNYAAHGFAGSTRRPAGEGQIEIHCRTPLVLKISVGEPRAVIVPFVVRLIVVSPENSDKLSRSIRF